MSDADANVTGAALLRPTLDHVIIVVEDLDHAAQAYESMGFTVSPRSIHPFGTANRLVLFANNFIELLAVHDRAALGNYEVVPRFLEARGHNGAWGVIWQAVDPAALHVRLEARGLMPSPLQSRITRAVELPGGRRETACFSSFALLSGNTPTYLEGFSHQHNPAAVFVEEWQRHENGAGNVVLTTISTDDIPAVADRWSRIFGDDVKCLGDRVVLAGANGALALVKRGRQLTSEPAGPLIEEVRIEVASIAILERVAAPRISESGPGWVRLAPSQELGISMTFCEATAISQKERR